MYFSRFLLFVLAAFYGGSFTYTFNRWKTRLQILFFFLSNPCTRFLVQTVLRWVKLHSINPYECISVSIVTLKQSFKKQKNKTKKKGCKSFQGQVSFEKCQALFSSTEGSVLKDSERASQRGTHSSLSPLAKDCFYLTTKSSGTSTKSTLMCR